MIAYGLNWGLKMDKKTAIVVIAYERVPFLYVNLSSIFRMNGIENYPVYVYVDQVSQQIQDLISDLTSDFPLEKLTFRNQLLQIRWNLLLALKEVFELGYENVIYLEEDHIIRSDALAKIEQTEFTKMFLSLSRRIDGEYAYCVLGNMVNRNSFFDIYRWIRNGEYIGEKIFGSDRYYTPPSDNDNPNFRLLCDVSYDHLFATYMDVCSLKSQYVGEQLVAHFGVVGMNFRSYHVFISATNMYNVGKILTIMFDGDKTQWLDNVASIFNNNMQKLSPPTFIPSEYKYF